MSRGDSGAIADIAAAGIAPRQHFDTDWPIQKRIVTYSTRVLRSPKLDSLGLPDVDLELGESTFGDDMGWLFWRRDGSARACSAWWGGPVPSVMDGVPGPLPPPGQSVDAQTLAAALGTVRPLADTAKLDNRFVAKNAAVPDWATKFPAGWTGLMGVAAQEYAQVETWHPSFLGLVAANKAHPEVGTRVFDVTDDGKIDKDRWAWLQDMWAVLDLGTASTPPAGVPPNGLSGYSLGIQLGRGGKIDSGPGYSPFMDFDASEIGFGARKMGGPFSTGEGNCQHTALGRDRDGNRKNPLHLPTSSLFIGEGGGSGRVGDAPLAFESTPWQRPTPVPGPTWTEVHLRLDREVFHLAGAAGPGVGLWKWQVPQVITVQPPPWIEDRWPPPGSRGDPPPGGPPSTRIPTGDPPPPRTPTGDTFVGQPRIATGDAWPSAGDPAATDPSILVQLGVREATQDPSSASARPREATGDPSILVQIGVREATGDPSILEQLGLRAPGGDTTPRVQTGLSYGMASDGTVPTVGSGYQPAIASSPMTVTVPSLAIKATATATGSCDFTGSAVPMTDYQRALWENAPFVAKFAGWAIGSGSWDGFTTYSTRTRSSLPKAQGGAMFLPPCVEVPDVLAGTAISSNPATLAFPSGLSKLGFGQPSQTTGGIVTGIEHSSDPTTGTLTAQGRDGSGAASGSTKTTTGGGFSTQDAAGNTQHALNPDGSHVIKQVSAGAVPTPAAGTFALFADSVTGHVTQKDSSGGTIDLAAGGSSAAGSPTAQAFFGDGSLGSLTATSGFSANVAAAVNSYGPITLSGTAVLAGIPGQVTYVLVQGDLTLNDTAKLHATGRGAGGKDGGNGGNAVDSATGNTSAGSGVAGTNGTIAGTDATYGSSLGSTCGGGGGGAGGKDGGGSGTSGSGQNGGNGVTGSVPYGVNGAAGGGGTGAGGRNTAGVGASATGASAFTARSATTATLVAQSTPWLGALQQLGVEYLAGMASAGSGGGGGGGCALNVDALVGSTSAGGTAGSEGAGLEGHGGAGAPGDSTGSGGGGGGGASGCGGGVLVVLVNGNVTIAAGARIAANGGNGGNGGAGGSPAGGGHSGGGGGGGGSGGSGGLVILLYTGTASGVTIGTTVTATGGSAGSGGSGGTVSGGNNGGNGGNGRAGEDGIVYVAKVSTASTTALSNQISMTNGDSVALTIGTPVLASSSGAARAQASSSSRLVLGLWQSTSTAAGATGQCQVAGPLTATTAQWDAVTGQTGGLTPGSRYWLDVTLGRLVSSPPTTTGTPIVEVGLAATTTTLLVRVQRDATLA